MLFLGFVPLDELEMTIKATNEDVIEYYYSLDELYYENGNDCEYTVIFLSGVEIELDDNFIMSFDSIEDN